MPPGSGILGKNSLIHPLLVKSAVVVMILTVFSVIFKKWKKIEKLIIALYNFFFNLLFILYWSTVSVLVSGVQQIDSVIHIHLPFFVRFCSLYRLLQNIEQSSLCYTVGPCWISILNISVYTCPSQTLNLPLPTIPLQPSIHSLSL